MKRPGTRPASLVAALSLTMLVSSALVNTAAGQQEITGLAPSMTGAVGCDTACVDAYEVKCIQASRTLSLLVEDLGTQDCLSVTLLGTTPTGMRGSASAVEVCGDSALVVLTRPTSAEGTMKALATVHAFTSSAGARDYRVTALCETGAGVDRTASLVLKSDQ